MTAVRYLALLRGINVGGGNVIKMADLKGCFEEMGFAAVATYIQSGNVVFRSEEKNAAKLMNRIERTLSGRFAYASRVVLRTRKQLAHVVEHAPRGFGKAPDKYRYDVIFVKEPLTETEAMRSVTTRPGVDAAHKGKGVLYFSRLTSKAAQSRLTRIVGLPVYQRLTLRNWNTTTRLLALMDTA